MELTAAINQLPIPPSTPPDVNSKNQAQRQNSAEHEVQGFPGDKVSISPEAREINATSSGEKTPVEVALSEDSQGFTQEELSTLTELKARDAEVRAHEQAHLAAAGGHSTGGASFTFQKGPDGNSYAVGGEVGIDLSKENDPNATIQKMRIIKRAALAPASPSSTDRQVAAQASVKEAQARQELLQVQQEELLSLEQESSPPQLSAAPENTSSPTAPSISSLKASLAVYEQISAM